MVGRRRPGGPSASQDEHADAVVIGSGFGGSVAAYRLAEAGRSVVLLERGKAYPPGSFARTPAAMGRNFWDPSEGMQGLFDVWTFRGLEGVVSSGLGGGSLIYANVLLRKDEKWFVQDSPVPGGGYESWPLTPRRPRPALRPRRADARGDAVPAIRRPPRRPPCATAPRGSGLDWQLPPLAVTFAGRPQDPPIPGTPIPTPAYGNVHGLPRSTCRLCGECDIGCNDGAKNTLDHTYLSAARAPRCGPADAAARCAASRPCATAATRCATSSTTRPTRAGRPAPAPSRCTGSPVTSWCSAPAPSARRTCCCATARCSRG